MHLGDLVLESSNDTGQVIERHLLAAHLRIIPRMNRWLAGEWCDREALVELLWRLEVGERCVAASVWLHDVAKASGEFSIEMPHSTL